MLTVIFMPKLVSCNEHLFLAVDQCVVLTAFDDFFFCYLFYLFLPAFWLTFHRVFRVVLLVFLLLFSDYCCYRYCCFCFFFFRNSIVFFLYLDCDLLHEVAINWEDFFSAVVDIVLKSLSHSILLKYWNLNVCMYVCMFKISKFCCPEIICNCYVIVV